MNPQDQALLTKYTLAAKKIIFNAGRMREFMKMLGSKEGALQAVHTVIAMVEKVKQVPPQIIPYLSANIYMVMVDVAQSVTGRKADPGIVKEVLESIMESVKTSHGKPPSAPMQAQSTPAQSAGIIGSQIGAAA